MTPHFLKKHATCSVDWWVGGLVDWLIGWVADGNWGLVMGLVIGGWDWWLALIEK